MKKYLLLPALLIFLFLPSLLQAQEQFGKTLADVKRSLESSAVQGTALKATDSTLVLSVTENGNPVRFVYGFDRKTGLCNYLKTVAGCDSCYRKYLTTMLSRTELGWKKINENQYVSNFESQLLIELPVNENDHSFMLFRTAWTRELYDIMLRN